MNKDSSNHEWLACRAIAATEELSAQITKEGAQDLVEYEYVDRLESAVVSVRQAIVRPCLSLVANNQATNETRQLSAERREGRALLAHGVKAIENACTFLESDPETPDLESILARLYLAVGHLEDFRKRRQIGHDEMEHDETEKERGPLAFL